MDVAGGIGNSLIVEIMLAADATERVLKYVPSGIAMLFQVLIKIVRHLLMFRTHTW